MNNNKFYVNVLVAILIITTSNILNAQFVIEQIEHEIPISWELIPEDVEFESQEDENNYLLKISENQLKEAAIEEGRDIQEEKSTIYMDGNNFAVESISNEMGKITMVADASTGTMYTVMWEERKVLEMSSEDMEEMEERSKVMAEQMLEKLPAEYRDQILAEMDTKNNKSNSTVVVKPTGTNNTINGFGCEEYFVKTDDKTMMVWASPDKIGITKEIQKFSDRFDQIFNSDDEEDIDEWSIISGKIPIQVRQVSTSIEMDEPVIIIQTITKLDKKKPSSDVFIVPGVNEGFTKSSMMDMMMQMMPSETP
jgi:hypothetical protein